MVFALGAAFRKFVSSPGARSALFISAALAITLGLGVDFAAGSSLKTATASVPVGPSHGTGSATAQCPSHYKVVSGGFNNQGAPDQGVFSDLIAYSSHRSGSRSWTVSAFNFSSSPGTLTALAYCRKGEGVKTGSASTAPPTETATTTASCPKNHQKVVSGGFDTPGFDPNFAGPRIFPYASLKSGKRSWAASGANNGGAAGALTAFAYCGNGNGVKTRSASSPVSAKVGSAPALATATADCKKKERLLSGGFSTPGFDLSNATGPDLYFFSSHRTGGRGWTASALNFGKAGTLNVFAYCEKK